MTKKGAKSEQADELMQKIRKDYEAAREVIDEKITMAAQTLEILGLFPYVSND